MFMIKVYRLPMLFQFWAQNIITYSAMHTNSIRHSFQLYRLKCKRFCDNGECFVRRFSSDASALNLSFKYCTKHSVSILVTKTSCEINISKFDQIDAQRSFAIRHYVYFNHSSIPYTNVRNIHETVDGSKIQTIEHFEFIRLNLQVCDVPFTFRTDIFMCRTVP